MVRALLLFAGLLASCTSGVRDIRLTDVDLGNMDVVADIGSQLDPQARIAFANYVVRHRSRSAKFCGQPLVNSVGKEPATVGEAIDLALIRDAAERRASIEASRPKHPGELAQEGWNELILARDMTIDAQTRLRMDYGDKATHRPEWKALAIRMSEIDRKLVAMKPSVFGG